MGTPDTANSDPPIHHPLLLKQHLGSFNSNARTMAISPGVATKPQTHAQHRKGSLGSSGVTAIRSAGCAGVFWGKVCGMGKMSSGSAGRGQGRPSPDEGLWLGQAQSVVRVHRRGEVARQQGRSVTQMSRSF